MIRSVIIGTGSCIPEINIPNETFSNAEFFEKDGSKLYKSGKSVIGKFQEITGIAARRYARPDQKASDLAAIAGQEAITDAGIDKESLDYIIVAHNFGDVSHESNRSDMVPSLASRVKALLGIVNPYCVAYDLPFGCPGWVEGVIQSNYFIRSGDAKRSLVIGAETLSRVIDPHDRDSMLYSDGAAAAILEVTNEERGVIAHRSQTYAVNYFNLLKMDHSFSPYSAERKDMYLKMNGRKVYEFALNHVPLLVKEVLDKTGVSIDSISKVLIHQANEKMDQAILERLFKLYNKNEMPPGVMPMTIGWLGNSSVATVPTLLDLIRKGKLEGHQFQDGDYIVFASVGAGMNINVILYKM